MFGYGRLRLIGQMIQHVPPLMNLAALDRSRLAGVLLYCRAERLAAIEPVQSRLAKIQPPIVQLAQ